MSMEGNKTESITETEMSNRLRYTWGQYFNISSLLVTLSSGSLVFYVNAYFISKSAHLPLSNSFFISAVISVFFGLIFTVLWRMLSQIAMEREILGNEFEVSNYFKKSNIKINYTSLFNKKGNSRFAKRIWLFSHYSAIISILLSWGLFIVSMILTIK